MEQTTGQGAETFEEAFSEKISTASGYDIRQTRHIEKALQTAIAQKQNEWDQSWKLALPFMVLFIFLYGALGATLTADLTSSYASHGHISIVYALEAIPVLIAFSGYVIAILYIFQCKRSANRIRNWELAILTLEKKIGSSLFSDVNYHCSGDTDYSGSRINITLALFIGLTWLVMYNYITFTTSGVMGSVISLFISTMTYVILDIQLLKSTLTPAPPSDITVNDDKADDNEIP